MIDIDIDEFDRRLESLARLNNSLSLRATNDNCRLCFANLNEYCSILNRVYEKKCPFKKTKREFEQYFYIKDKQFFEDEIYDDYNDLIEESGENEDGK